MKSLGLMLVFAGALLALLGLALLLADKLPFLGRLPGDIHIEGRRGSFHFPIVTCLVLSLVLTLALNLLGRFFRH